MKIEGLSIPRYNDTPLMGNYLPYGHQIVARDTIEEKDNFFLFITSPTGSGKTDSWAVPALAGDKLGVVLALYPTNALAQDQYNSLNSLKSYLGSSKKIELLTAETIKNRIKTEFSGYTKGEVIEAVIRDLYRNKGGVVVTNPDTFIYIMKKYYSNPYLDSVVCNLVTTLVFDEFHLYDVKQSGFILFLLHEVIGNKKSSLKKFIFLSATPEKSIVNRIRNVIKGELVIANEYFNGEVADERQILPEVDTDFFHSRRFSSGEKFIEIIPKIIPYFEGRRTAIIFDSVLEVRKISEVLRDIYGFKVCEVSGFSKDSIDDGFDVLVGNKAVEVGVDFKGKTSIQNLVFSGHSVSEFLQRFGRLRNPEMDINYNAFCFAPKETVDSLSNYKKICRPVLTDLLNRTMKDPGIIENFRWHYGYIEAIDHIKKNATGRGLRDDAEWRFQRKKQDQKGGMPSDKRIEYLQRSLRLVYDHYLKEGGISIRESEQMISNIFSNPSNEMLRIAEQLSLFRGTSYDLVYLDSSGRVGKYNLFYLLRWGDVEIQPENEFKKSIRGIMPIKDLNDLSKNSYGYALLNGFRDEPRKVSLNGPVFDEMYLSEVDRKPCFVHGISVRIKDDLDGNPVEISGINKKIESEGLFVRYLPFKPYQSRMLYDIDDYTPVFGFKDGSLAIGTDAICVDCAIKAASGR